MTDSTWIFDGLPPSRAKKGGNPEEHVFKLTLDTLVREVLQNCHDQKLNTDEPVRVEFRLHDFHGSERERLLEAINWDVLEGHLAGMAAERGPVGETFARELREIRDREFLRVLYITDFGAKGLVGAEDDSESNFGALCRHILNTNEDDQERGGSYGLGKALLWAFSGVATVMFSSRLSVPERHGTFRLFGRANLSYHSAHGAEWEGLGFFGLPDSTGRERTVSVWGDDAESIAAELGMSVAWTDGSTGTGILLFDFNEPEEEEDRGLAEIAAEIRDAASRWFWPCIVNGTLSVQTRAYDGKQNVFDEESTADLEEILPFVEITRPGGDGLKDRLAEDGDRGERRLEVTVPPRKATGNEPADKGGASPAILRLGLSASESPWSGRVALIRGAGMVVEYWTPSSGVDSDLNLYGVCLAGSIVGPLAGSLEEVTRLELFLRAAEPPSHNGWTWTTRRVQRDYGRGSQAAIRTLFIDINSAIKELGGAAPPPGDRGPEGLAKRLDPGSGVTPPSVPQVDLVHPRAHLDEERVEWIVEGGISRRSTDESWQASICLMLATDGGSSIRGRLDLAGGESLTAGVTCQVEDRFLLVSVPAGITEAGFKVWSVPLYQMELESDNPEGERGQLSVVAKRAGLSVDVRDASKRGKKK